MIDEQIYNDIADRIIKVEGVELDRLTGDRVDWKLIADNRIVHNVFDAEACRVILETMDRILAGEEADYAALVPDSEDDDGFVVLGDGRECLIASITGDVAWAVRMGIHEPTIHRIRDVLEGWTA